MRFDAEFLQFSVILGDLEAPILSSLGTNRVNKRALKIDAKRAEKVVARCAGKPCPGIVGP